jgi:hypothetical protein
MQGNAIINEYFSNIKMILGVPGKSVHLINHESINLAFMLPAIFNGSQKLGSLGGFSGSSFFAKNFQSLNALVLAISTAKILLMFQRGALDLFIA